MKISKSQIKQMIEEEAADVLGEKANPSGVNPSHFPLKLSDVDPALAKVVATKGQDDGAKDDDDIEVEKKPTGVAPVGNLKPSQSSMNIGKAMTFVIHMLDPTSRMEPGGDLGAFISSDGFIMDGHHRWISTAMVDPSKSVGGYEVDFPGKQLVAILNAMTKGRYGEMEGKPASGGFEQFKEKPIRDMLTQMVQGGISKATVPDTFDGWQARSPEQVQEVIETWTGEKGEDAVESAVTKMVNNLSGLSMNTPPWAPARPDMPVIDEPNIPDAVKALASGEVDVNKPYFREPEGELAESKNIMTISTARLKKIIKEELQNRKRNK